MDTSNKFVFLSSQQYHEDDENTAHKKLKTTLFG